MIKKFELLAENKRSYSLMFLILSSCLGVNATLPETKSDRLSKVQFYLMRSRGPFPNY